MPFVSLAQEGYMHEHPSVLGKKGLAEWDHATKGSHLPEHVNEHKGRGPTNVHHELKKHTNQAE